MDLTSLDATSAAAATRVPPPRHRSRGTSPRRNRHHHTPSSHDYAVVAERRRRRSPAPVAFASEVLPHQQTLYATALRLTRQPNDAEDLVQDTMLRAFKAWARFEPGSNCRAWLLRILTNSFINNYRRRRRHQRFANECPEDAVVALYGESHERTSNPEKNLIGHTLSDEVTAALARLGDDYRQVVELADLRGVRYRDIADTLGVPIGTVMSRLFRARRQLERELCEFAASDYGIRRAA